jgi:hypothetical protein
MKNSPTDRPSDRGIRRALFARPINFSLLAAFGAAALASSPLRAQTGAIPTPNSPTTSSPTTSAANQTAPARPAVDASKFLRYVRVGANGAKVRNIYDAQGLVVLEAKAGEVLAVYSERTDWLEVEAPSGFAVWVFGEYLAPASEGGVLQVTGEGVLMRPQPSSSSDSLPLRQRLGRGEKLRLIGRRDLSKPMAEDWVNVWSPPRARAWVKSSETTPLEAGVDGAKLWAEAVASARPLASAPLVDASATTPSNGSDVQVVRTAMEEGERLLSAARAADQAGGTPDYAAARASFEKAAELAGSGPSADLAKQRVKLCSTYEEAWRLTAELKQHEATQADALRRREEALRAAERRGVFDGRFDARGWVERVVVKGEQQPIYLLRFGGASSAELVCTSGRLRIEDFLDVEIGVSGRELRGAIVGPTAALSRPRELDVSRLEVISARRTK